MNYKNIAPADKKN